MTPNGLKGRAPLKKAPKAPFPPGEGQEAGPSVQDVEPVPAWRTQAAYRLGGAGRERMRGPAVVPSGDQISEAVQPLRDSTLEASADFLLAAWFLWMTPFETALSS